MKASATERNVAGVAGREAGNNALFEKDGRPACEMSVLPMEAGNREGSAGCLREAKQADRISQAANLSQDMGIRSIPEGWAGQDARWRSPPTPTSFASRRQDDA